MAPRRDSKDEGSRKTGARPGGGDKKRTTGTDARAGAGRDAGSNGFQVGDPPGVTPSQAREPRESKSGGKSSAAHPSGKRRTSQRAIPDSVANRMARRSAIASGFPTVMGMAVFVASYLLVSRDILDIPPSATLVASGGCFLLGLVGLSYGVFSSSWEDKPGTLLGSEQIRLNVGRLRESIRSMRQAGPGDSRG